MTAILRTSTHSLPVVVLAILLASHDCACDANGGTNACVAKLNGLGDDAGRFPRDEGKGGNGIGGNTAFTAGRGNHVVAMVQSSKSQATELTDDDVNSMVAHAVEIAGGLAFIQDGQTVVLKPNLLTPFADCWSGGAGLSPTVNGVTTDYRVTKAVASLVRQRDPTGMIIVMEGSNRNTLTAFSMLGYTRANFGDLVDEFVALEGAGCSSRSDSGLVERPSASGRPYWVNERYYNAEVVISVGAMKTHNRTGTTGCVKNLGIGATPSAHYSVSTSDGDCTRNMHEASLPGYIDHGSAGLADFISEFYSVRPADFAVMDGLQGLQHGPCTPNAPESDRMNMRLILAARNAIALDATQARLMGCDPESVLHLVNLAAYGLGPVRSALIDVRGVRQGTEQTLSVEDMRQLFASGVSDVCAF